MAYTTIDNPADHFNTVLYTGNGGTQSITGVGFAPNLAWIKNRGETNHHRLMDTTRGATKDSYPDLVAAEATTANGLTSFDSDGFSLGSDAGFNKNNITYVSWNWLAGASTSANTDGSINSTVTVNQTAGFSIVSYVGTDANATVGHGLGVAPNWVLVKGRTTANNWRNGHDGLTSWAYRINLEDGGTESSQSSVWNSTAPTNTVFSIGDSSSVSDNGITHMAYCFAEKKGYSKFGSYTGNGNADGTFVFTGFRRSLVIYKRTNNAADWHMYDNKRDPFNEMDLCLFPSGSYADSPGDALDFLSNGFKQRNTGAEANASGDNYIYMAFAENPFVNSNGVPTNAR